MTDGPRRLTIFPALDLQKGRCVRLRQGRAEDAVVYSDDPPAVAKRWVSEGATYLHVVDLDGAFAGAPVHTKAVAEIVRAAGVPVQVGGGIRTDEDIRTILGCGAARAILGTRALREPDDLRRLVREFGDGLAVALDAKGGKVQVRGWVESTLTDATDLARAADAAGIQTLICTDIARDGMLRGMNAQAVDAVCACVRSDVIASGGVSSARDIVALRELRRPNLVGAIVGKALYEGTVRLADLLTAASPVRSERGRPC